MIELHMNTATGLQDFLVHACSQELTPQIRTMTEKIIAYRLRPALTDMERADIHEDYTAMLRMPSAHHKLYGQWIHSTDAAYTWNVLVSSNPVAAQVRAVFFHPGTATTLMAVIGAMYRIWNDHDDDSQQTADIKLYLQQRIKSNDKYVNDFWDCILSVESCL
jgi:hypothetical protein